MLHTKNNLIRTCIFFEVLTWPRISGSFTEWC